MTSILAFPVMPDIPEYRTMAETLLQEASEATGISGARLRGGERSKRIAVTRFAIMWTLREYSGMSLPEIGKAVGNRDHTTVMHACRRAKALRATDPAFKALCDRLAGVVQKMGER